MLSANRRQHGDVPHSGIGVGVLELAGPPLPQEVLATHAEVVARGAIKEALLGGAAEPTVRASDTERRTLSGACARAPFALAGLPFPRRGDGGRRSYPHVTGSEAGAPVHADAVPLLTTPYGQQVPSLGQQKVLTSETQSAVHPNDGSQHVGSWAQTLATQGSLQPVAHSAAPAVHTLWH